jgi:hypothetical protein
MDLVPETAGRLRIIFRDVLPNLGDVLSRKRMKGKALH